MLHRGELLGVLSLHEMGESTRKITEADANLLMLLASQAAGVVHTARLLEETRARAEQLALLYDAGLTLNRVLDSHEQLEFLLNITKKALSAERADFFRFDPAYRTRYM